MKIKVKFSGSRSGEIEITVKEAGMVKPVEAKGHRSICTLLDVQDWDTARARLKELGVGIAHQKNKPLVNIEEVNEASKRWHRKHKKK